MIKNLPAMQKTWVPSLGWEDPLERGMATHPSILAWRIPWTEEPGRILEKSQTWLSEYHSGRVVPRGGRGTVVEKQRTRSPRPRPDSAF